MGVYIFTFSFHFLDVLLISKQGIPSCCYFLDEDVKEKLQTAEISKHKWQVSYFPCDQNIVVVTSLLF